MRSGSGRAGDGGNGKKQTPPPPPPPPPPGVHPRYVPKRGAVLKGTIRNMLRCFLFTFPPISGPVNSSSGRRVRPAPAGAGGDGAEQGK